MVKERKPEKLDVIARQTKRAIDRWTALYDIPAVLKKPKYRRVGGMKLLDQDRKLAKAEMHRMFSVIGRTTLVRSHGGKWTRP